MKEMLKKQINYMSENINGAGSGWLFLIFFVIGICLYPMFYKMEYKHDSDISIDIVSAFMEGNNFSENQIINDYVFDANNIMSDTEKKELNQKAEEIYKNTGVKAYFLYYDKSPIYNMSFQHLLLGLLIKQSDKNAPAIMYLYNTKNDEFYLYSRNTPKDMLYDNRKNDKIINQNDFNMKEFNYDKESFLEEYKNSLEHIETISKTYLQKGQKGKFKSKSHTNSFRCGMDSHIHKH